MSDIKWIKVAVDMFEDNKIEFIRSLPEGDAIIVTWIQMLSIAGQANSGGYLMVTEGIPYTEQLLSNKLRRQPVFLQFAIETLTKLKMINVDDGPFHITKWEKHQNVDGMEKVRLDTAKRVATHRAKKKEQLKLQESNVTVTLHVTPNVTHCNETDIDIEKEIIYLPEIDDVKSIFEYWNEKGIVKHRELTQKMRSTINARLETYTVDELREAIDNYSSILKSDKHFFSYKWALNDFFNPSNVVMFLTENDPYTNYLKDKNKRAARAPVYELPTIEPTEQERERLARAFQQQRELNASNH